ncbi:MAG: hypothetical protein JNM84_20525 [Planctomycetes bacterium]|nr:hypothetical protein [Planctomycetota bacterium]
MRVTTAEDAGEVWIDGHPMGHRDVRVATPRGPATNLEWYRDGQRVGGRIAELEAPLGYGFPFDYLFEALLPLPASWRTEFRIEADPPPPPSGVDLGPYPENAWRALWHQVRIEALRSRILQDALDRRAALRREGRPTGTLP